MGVCVCLCFSLSLCVCVCMCLCFILFSALTHAFRCSTSWLQKPNVMELSIGAWLRSISLSHTHFLSLSLPLTLFLSLSSSHSHCLLFFLLSPTWFVLTFSFSSFMIQNLSLSLSLSLTTHFIQTTLEDVFLNVADDNVPVEDDWGKEGRKWRGVCVWAHVRGFMEMEIGRDRNRIPFNNFLIKIKWKRLRTSDLTHFPFDINDANQTWISSSACELYTLPRQRSLQLSEVLHFLLLQRNCTKRLTPPHITHETSSIADVITSFLVLDLLKEEGRWLWQ